MNPAATYGLTPLQQGMLFHHLLDPAGGVDIEQLVCTLLETVDERALRDAWARVSLRHDVLRTAIRWQGVEQPVQDVYAHPPLLWDEHDWRDERLDAHASRLRDFLAADRRRGFDLSVAPLQRFALIRVGDAEWRLVWTFHHAILDGRSFPIVLREVFDTYAALRRGEERALAPPRPYSEFVEWLLARDFDASAPFWRDRLKGFNAPTPLPANVDAVPARALSASPRQGDCERRLSRDVTAALDALATAAGVTMNTVVHGAWAILLARHAGQDDVVFGATRACRRSAMPGAETMVGLFINTVPVRVRVDGRARLGEWLRTIRAEWNALREVEHTPLARVQEWSDVPPGTPLFNTLVVFENYLLETSLRGAGGDWAGRRVHLFEQTNYPITVAVYGGDELTVKLDFDATRISDATAASVLRQLCTLLEGMAADADATLASLPWIDEGERQLVIEQWNATTRPYPRDSTIAQRFAEMVQRAPDAVAVVHGSTTLTYAELDIRSNRLAHRLRRLGVGRDTPVGLCVARSADMVVAALAILKAGGGYVTLDPDYPRERLAFMLQDSGARVVVTQDVLYDRIPGERTGAEELQVIRIDADWSTIAQEPAHAPAELTDAEGLAYVIFTSGSTGVPKGVAAAHRGVMRLVCNSDFAHLGPDEVLLSFAPLNFDASTLELWGALLNGARLVIHPTHAPSLEELASVIERYGVTTLWLTAALFHQFVDAHLEGLRPLRQLLAGGDVLSVPHVVRVRTELPHLRLINGYGPTENTTFTCCYTVPSPDEVGSTVSIGKPVSNTTVYLLDDACRPVPVGVAGRLFTGGDGLARGYLGRPELTAERFLTDPFSTLANARMYDTGDLARWRNDGTIEFLGRADEQLKIRGFRIEPGEIEAALLATGMVRECVVVGRTDAGADKRLVAYVVLPESPPTPASAILELREHIARTLPPYMMPASFVTLDTLPLTSSGKVDRKRLPAPEPEQARARPLVAPRTHLEALLHATWAAVLPTERIGVEDDFFALGGDSILMIRAIARARDAGFRISPRDVYANPTIATLAAFIAASQPAAEETDAIDHELERNVPLTPVQRWFFEGEHVELNHWNQAFLLTVPPAFDVDAIDIAMRAVVNRHDAFRLRFDEHASGWTQRVERSDSAASRFVRRVDLSDLPEDEHADAIARASRDVHASFDVRRGPLIGTVYLDLGAERQGRLFVAAHHLAVDGVSWGVLLSELEAEYRRATDSSVPTAAGRFSRWAARIADYARSADVAGELSYWEQAGAPAAPLPSDRAIDAADDVVANADVVSVQLDEEETRALLQRVPAAYRTQINDVLLSALARTLDVSGDGEVMIDLESHGREDLFVGLDVSRTIGWFTSIFPVRLPASRGPIGASLLAMKERLRAIPRRGIGYGLLRYSAGVQSLRAQPTPQVSFNYLGQMDQVLAGSSLFSFASESTGAWLGARARRRHAVEINAMVMRGRLTFEWSFSRLRHDQGTVATLASTYLTHLRAIVAHCLTEGVGGYSPSDFPLAALTQEQLDRVIGAARDVEDIYPLAPIQRLYHGFADPGDDPGFEQWRYRMSGALDVDALCNAWQLVVDRHAILRTSFVTEGLAEPMQVVRRAAKVAVEQHDWRSSSTEEQAVQVRDLLEADRSRGFDFTRAPLLRLHVIRLGATRYEIVWSHHHLLLDRWSFPLVLRDVRIAYDAVRRRATPAFEPVVPFRDYVAWLAGRGDEAETFWRRIFANYAPTGALAGYVSKEGATAPPELDAAGDMILRLGAERTRALHSFAAAHGVSVNTVVTAAWALWLARQLRTEDVVLGLSVAGRPADIAGVDRMVGVTINNLPLRVRLAARMPVGDWLLDVQRGQADVAHYAHTPLERVHGWSGVPWRLRLFDSILVFQHAGADETNASWLGADVSLSPVPVATHTAYPLSIVIGGSKELAVRVSWDAAQLNAAQAARAGQGLADALQALTTFDTVSAALAALPEPVASAQMRPTDLALAHVPARTATESVLARLLGDLLEIEDVGITDNFFAIGGNSLVATQLASRVRDTLRVEVPVRLVFANPTVEGLAGALAAREAVSGQLEKIAGVVKRVQSMTLDEVRRASTAGAALT